ncbi:MBL fold metallo-hydrolase [Clostridiaceae bacterium]|nr:MBL fold metallo-hydrolase [Clostridiaceae bacterium]NBI82303.1 MBL fold metallo-hydrolase [Clostridiaceae bacterium]
MWQGPAAARIGPGVQGAAPPGARCGGESYYGGAVVLQIDFINVGSGDAALLRVNDYAALVDCGNVSLGECRPGSKRIMAADFLRREGVEKLDLVVLTHLHRDHIGGFSAVLSAAHACELWTNYLPAPGLWECEAAIPEEFPKKARGLGKSLSVYLPALRRAQARGTVLREITRPVTVPLTDGLSVEVGCLGPEVYERQRQALDNALRGAPDPDALQAAGAALNEASLRLLLRYQGQTVLLAGDAYGSCWEGQAAHCTVFKVPHHASPQSMGRALAQALSPETAVISCGAYRDDGRPDPQVVAWLREASGEVLCTDACQVPGLSGEDHRAVTVLLGADN